MNFQETFAHILQSDLPLQGKLGAFKVEFDTRLAPPAAVEALHRSVDELIASGAPARALIRSRYPKSKVKTTPRPMVLLHFARNPQPLCRS